MEFKFRAIDDRPPISFPPSPNLSFFTEQALRVGYSTTTELLKNDLYHQNNMREALNRELEKEQIREEIIAAEIARKRRLEAEVRREMMIEREMAFRKAGRFSIFPPSPASGAMWFDLRRPMLSSMSEAASLEERIGRSLEERIGFQARRESNITLETAPFRLNLEASAQTQTPEVKPLLDSSKEKMLFVAKPDLTLSGTKRKAVTPAVGSSELPTIGSKKPKEEWSCALCQVSATSERGLNEHLQGRKHKAKEAGLIAHKGGKHDGTTPRKPGKPTKPAETVDAIRSDQGVKLEGKVLRVNKTKETSVPITQGAEASEKKDESPVQKKAKADKSKKKNGELAVLKMPKKERKFRFWCEMCQVGAHSEVVLNNHKQGKKHKTRLQEHSQNGSTMATPPTTKPLPDTAREADDGGSGQGIN